MRAFIVLCLVAVACADKLGYNYQPVGHSNSGLSFAPGSGSIGGGSIGGGSLGGGIIGGGSLGGGSLGGGSLGGGSIGGGSLGGLSGLGGLGGLGGQSNDAISAPATDGGVAPALNFASAGPVRQATAQNPDNSYLPSSVFRRLRF
ncbi:Hypothetical predicted protein [Drosophila guanche]|uniref:Uncharacterized protein n=1 Tax=Drosophila guanche TaxID=7266 RepID=A0A3B0JFA9_DROGU|nr:Hypothetical predicted protein [Drosophila guanche]